MEFMQFHPTVLYIAGSSRHLITEAIRGEGAYLRDRDGHRFMPDYHPAAELAPRDDVSRAIVAQMAKTQHPNVYLDLSHLDPALHPRPLPRDRRALQGVRPRRHPRPDPGPPRRPLHGRRRDDRPRRPDHPARPLGRRRGHQLRASTAPTGWPRTACSKGSSTGPGPPRTSPGPSLDSGPHRLEVPPIASEPEPRANRAPLDLADIRDSLRALMWRSVGITRDARGLAEAADQVDFWCRYALNHVFDDPDRLDLAEHAHRRPPDDRRRPRTRGVARRPHPERLPRDRPRLGPPHHPEAPAAGERGRAAEAPW